MKWTRTLKLWTSAAGSPAIGKLCALTALSIATSFATVGCRGSQSVDSAADGETIDAVESDATDEQSEDVQSRPDGCDADLSCCGSSFDRCTAFQANPLAIGPLPRSVNELSGLAASGCDPSIVWAHNDSGDSARLFALALSDGATRREVELPGVSALDWEDMASGPCENGSGSCLFVGDTGDNLRQRGQVPVHRIEEATLLDDLPDVALETAQFEIPGGPADVEAIFVDSDGRIYFLTKEHGRSRVLVGEFAAGETTLMDEVATIDLSAGAAGAYETVTGADYDAAAGNLLLRTYSAIYLMEGVELRAGRINRLPTPLSTGIDIIGESVAWVPGGIVHGSEGTGSTLWFEPCDSAR